MKTGFIFKYSIIDKDKGLIPEICYSRDSSYFEWLGDFSLNIGQKAQTMSIYKPHQNYPNSFNPSTKISFTIPNVGTGLALSVLKVYDVLGNEVATLVDEHLEAGKYEVTFDASNLTSGIYFYRLQAGSFIETKKMILLK